VCGIFAAVPWLGFMTLVGFLYTIYLLYLGLPHVMKTPSDQVVTYLIVSVLAIVVLYALFGSIAASIGLGSISASR
jgi:hypothetical protein